VRGARVLDLSNSIAGAWCARLLAMAGADVIKVEPPDGDPLRREPPLLPADGVEGVTSALFAYLNAYKRGITLDRTTKDRHDLRRRLAYQADAVISDFEPPAPRPRVSNPGPLGLVAGTAPPGPPPVRTVISHFGLTGPYHSYQASDLTDWAVSGYLQITGDPAREPLQGGGPWCAHATGLTAAVATVAALLQERTSVRGQQVDVSAFEAMAALHQWSMVLYTHQGVVKRRAGNRHAESYHPLGLQPVKDGAVCIAVASAAQWQNFCLALELPELLVERRFATGGDRFDHADEIDARIRPWLLARTRDEVVDQLQAFRVPAAKVLRPGEVLQEPVLDARSFWDRPHSLGTKARMPGPPFRIGGLDVPFREAPRLGEHDAQIVDGQWPAESEEDAATPARRRGRASIRRNTTLPLAGVRVLELTVAWSGPLAGRWLADLGADVIHVETRTARGLGMGSLDAAAAQESAGWTWGTLPGPIFRSGVYPDADPGERPWNRQGIWNKMNRNKRSLCLDMKTAAGAAVFRELVAASDVVLDNWRPRALPSLGFDYATLTEINPALVVCSLSGYGSSGPYRDRVSFGPILEAHAGQAALTGYGTGEASDVYKLGAAFPDAIGGLTGAFAILAALWERERTGRGCFVDVSQYEAYTALLGPELLTASLTGEEPRPIGNRSPLYAPQGVYPCAGDDAWLALTVRLDEEWQTLLDVMGTAAAELHDGRLQTVDGRRQAVDEIDRVIGAWTRTLDKQAAMATLQAAGIAAAAVLTNQDIVEDLHLDARGFMAEVDQADVGRRRFAGFPVHFSETEISIRGAPPLGGDNASILRDLLGRSEEEVGDLEAAGVIAQTPQ
jgi:crotonobetainyl-CoA:carnitine CoA-transferase CaiB-like acyl-CoA transferase